MDDVVVIGYGTVNKKNLTGSLSTIKPSDYNNQLITNSTDILKGRVAGVSITEASGATGGDFKIRIRGVNSLLGGNDPLIVVDGIQGDIKSKLTVLQLRVKLTKMNKLNFNIWKKDLNK